jgi:hypothetical protein
MNCHKNNYYHTHIFIIIKQLTYDNENSKNAEFMHNRIMLSLKIILELITSEAYLKNC